MNHKLHVFCFEKLSTFYYAIGIDIRKILESPVEHRKYYFHLHNTTTIIFMLFSASFYYDFFVLNGYITSSLVDFFNLNNSYKKYIYKDQVEIVYVFFTLCQIPLCIIYSIYFFSLYKNSVRKEEFFDRIFFNLFITSLVGIFSSVVFASLFFIGGWVMVIGIPKKFSIDDLWIIRVIQVVILAKAQGFISVCLTSAMQAMVPEWVGWRKKVEEV